MDIFVTQLRKAMFLRGRVFRPPQTKENRIGKPKTAYLCGFQNGHKKQRITGIEPALFSSLLPVFMREVVSGVETSWKHQAFTMSART